MFGLFKKNPPQPPRQFPPVPKWRPAIDQPLIRVIERVAHYTNRQQDFAVFEYGTCVLVQNGPSEEGAIAQAKDAQSNILNSHPDMNPIHMSDGNITVQYNPSALNVVFEDIVRLNWDETEQNHRDALATSEVLMTPLGPNKFDDFGKRALFGRCFMFMDAQNPKVVRVERAAV